MPNLLISLSPPDVRNTCDNHTFAVVIPSVFRFMKPRLSTLSRRTLNKYSDSYRALENVRESFLYF